jgi:glycosyltransferase involved in cell wall biosynthesis
LNKNIVIITNYYPPEIGAAANRIKNMASGLNGLGNNISVICPLPNYPNGEIFEKYRGNFSVTEKVDNINIKRYWIYSSISKNPISRFLSMLSFAITLWFSFFKLIKKKPDLFIIQSPPLLIALSGLLFSKLLGVKNILNVSDIWPLSAFELGVMNKNRFYNLLEKIESWNYALADKIMGQSNEIISHIKLKVNKKFLVYRNTPDYKLYNLNDKDTEKVKIIYAGLLGFAQDVLQICRKVDFKNNNSELHIYGAGMQENDIIKFCENNDKNIFFHGSRNAFEIKEEIRKYDVSIVPLKANIYGAVPSKIFELMQLGVPILYVGGGEAKDIILKSKIGLVSKPNDFKKIEENILEIKGNEKALLKEFSANCLKYHKEEYNLSMQMKKFKNFIN